MTTDHYMSGDSGGPNFSHGAEYEAKRRPDGVYVVGIAGGYYFRITGAALRDLHAVIGQVLETGEYQHHVVSDPPICPVCTKPAGDARSVQLDSGVFVHYACAPQHPEARDHSMVKWEADRQGRAAAKAACKHRKTEERPLWTCEDCGPVADEPVDGPLYECSNDGTFLREDSYDGDSNRCPACRKFSAKSLDGPLCGSCRTAEVAAESDATAVVCTDCGEAVAR